MTAGKEVWMLPGSRSFKVALVGTQSGDFVARYIKFRYDTEEINKGMDPEERRKQAINDTLAAFIYYDLPQNEYLQYANDMGFGMFTKFFFRIQPVIARMFLKNPLSASVYTGLQTTLLDAPWDENIANFGGMSMLGLYFYNEPHTFDMTLLIQNSGTYARAFQAWAWIALFIGFAIKIPAFPFHTWLPDAHVEAPTAISVILAGVLLKMGTYGILRINYGMLPVATQDFAFWALAALARSTSCAARCAPWRKKT